MILTIVLPNSVLFLFNKIQTKQCNCRCYYYIYKCNAMQCNVTLRYVLLCYVSINNYIYTYISVSCCLFPEHLTTSLLLYFLVFVGFYFSSLCWVAMSLRSGIRIPDIDHVLLECTVMKTYVVVSQNGSPVVTMGFNTKMV